MRYVWGVLAVLMLLRTVGYAEPMTNGNVAAQGSDKDVTITSDQLELKDHGALTIFTGHVVLTQPPKNVLTADQMQQAKPSQVVNAEGHIHGTWYSDTGEKIIAVGRRGRFDPQSDTAELWEHARLTRYQMEKDTAPMVVTAGYFDYHKKEQKLYAQHRVHMVQAPKYATWSDEAMYDENEKILHLWEDTHRTILETDDPKGKSHFECDRALIYTDTKHARLMDHVHGHIIPAP